MVLVGDYFVLKLKENKGVTKYNITKPKKMICKHIDTYNHIKLYLNIPMTVLNELNINELIFIKQILNNNKTKIKFGKLLIEINNIVNKHMVILSLPTSNNNTKTENVDLKFNKYENINYIIIDNCLKKKRKEILLKDDNSTKNVIENKK